MVPIKKMILAINVSIPFQGAGKGAQHHHYWQKNNALFICIRKGFNEFCFSFIPLFSSHVTDY